MSKVESQLVSVNTLKIQGNVNSACEQIVQAMFDLLQHRVKMDRAELQSTEDKRELHKHVNTLKDAVLELIQEHACTSVGSTMPPEVDQRVQLLIS